MTAAAYSLDGAKNYATNSFPDRTSLHPRQEGAGHWLVAYRETEEQKHRNLQRRIKETNRKYERRGTDAPPGNTLDRAFLLQVHCVGEPYELCSVHISEKKLKSVKKEALQEFINVAFIDASINSLTLDYFSMFVSLKELNLSLNGLRDLSFHAADFPLLQVLDLSYNTLSANAIMSIGQLPRLKALHLTGNQIQGLPPNLASSNREHSQLPPAGADSQFEALEVLMLDHNKLTSAVFSSLIDLKRLRHLNLQGNHISGIPYLQPSGSSTEVNDKQQGFAHAESNTDEHLERMSQIIDKDHYKGGYCLPLPALQSLSLADNKIAEEEALMAAALFPALQEIDIQSNPLTTQRRGEPPLLTYYLQDRLGITIKWKKLKEAVKLPVKVFTVPKWKCEERIPNVSKRPVLNDARIPDPTPAERKHKSSRSSVKSFFVTQATDVPEFEFDPQPDEEESAESGDRNVANTEPAEFLSYELFVDAKLNPDVPKTVGIQTAVGMLEHTLKSLSVYRDSKPKLDSIQTPYREKQKRMKELPPVRLRQPSERVDEIIKEIKQSSSVRKLSLSGTINRSSVSKHREAQALLREMRTKYKMVHRRTTQKVGGRPTTAETYLYL